MNEGFDEIFEKMEQGYLLIERGRHPNPTVITLEKRGKPPVPVHTWTNLLLKSRGFIAEKSYDPLKGVRKFILVPERVQQWRERPKYSNASGSQEGSS